MLTFKVLNNDIPVGAATGRPLTVEGTDKFTQDVREVLDVVANLGSVVGMVGDIFSLRAEISKRVNSAFALYKAAQDATQRTDRPVEERFSRIVQVVVLPLRDPQSNTFAATSYAFRVDALSMKGGSPSTVTGVIAR